VRIVGAPEDEYVDAHAWHRAQWLPLALGRGWSSGEHTAATDVYNRLDALDIPPAAKIERLRDWLHHHAPPRVVDTEIDHLRRIAARFDPADEPPSERASVKRLRVVAPSEGGTFGRS